MADRVDDQHRDMAERAKRHEAKIEGALEAERRYNEETAKSQPPAPGPMLATSPKDIREVSGSGAAVMATRTSQFFIASADPARPSWLNSLVLKQELQNGYDRTRLAMGLPNLRTLGPRFLPRGGIRYTSRGQGSYDVQKSAQPPALWAPVIEQMLNPFRIVGG